MDMEKQYRINEIFYSLQGEGRHTGRAAVFVRFSGCNLHCPFCDTDFKSHTLMTASDIVKKVAQWKDCGFVVLTGGEPSLQADEPLVSALHREGFYVAMETNGTHAVAKNVDWVTLSPKNCFVSHAQPLKAERVDEMKVVFDGVHDPKPYGKMAHDAYLCLQPCDTGDKQRNQQVMKQCVEYIQKHPQWHLSLQTHKLIHIQ
jgi:organic radical activating enzyme